MRTGDVACARWTILAVALQVRQLQCHSTELLPAVLKRRLCSRLAEPFCPTKPYLVLSTGTMASWRTVTSTKGSTRMAAPRTTALEKPVVLETAIVTLPIPEFETARSPADLPISLGSSQSSCGAS